MVRMAEPGESAPEKRRAATGTAVFAVGPAMSRPVSFLPDKQQ